MAYFSGLPRLRLGLQVSALTLITVGFAGCSSDVSRFDANPFASSRSAPAPEVTGSIARGPAAPTGRVESRPLPQTGALPPPPPTTHLSSTGTSSGGYGSGGYSSGGVSTGAGGMASYRPPSQSYEVTGSVPPGSRAASTLSAPPQQRVATIQSSMGQGGGHEITVGPGQTLSSISRSHGVSVAALMKANSLSSPNLHIGQRLVLPGQHSAQVAPPMPAVSRPAVAQRSPAPQTVAAAPAYGGFHVAGPGDTLSKIAHRYRVSLADLAKANRMQPYGSVKVGDRLVIPSHTSALQQPAAAAPQATASVAPPKAQPKLQQVAALPKAEAANLAKATETPAEAKAEPVGALFRWPARGRIVAAFGAKPNGQQNDGINIALPEGTPIKAAEGGEVAYAGNELKGYGNLILIRHPNGFVTAYAHASELLVKRGEKVKRGEVIAKSGQTGNIGSPQLHFEIRKGSTPIDPSPYLGS